MNSPTVPPPGWRFHPATGSNRSVVLDRGLATFLASLLLASTFMWWSMIEFGDPFGVRWLVFPNFTLDQNPSLKRLDQKSDEGNLEAAGQAIGTEASRPLTSVQHSARQEEWGTMREAVPERSLGQSPPSDLVSASSRRGERSGRPSQGQRFLEAEQRSPHQGNLEARGEQTAFPGGKPVPQNPPIPQTHWPLRDSWFGLQWQRESPWFRALRPAGGPSDPSLRNDGIGFPAGTPKSGLSPSRAEDEDLSSVNMDSQFGGERSSSEGAPRLRLPPRQSGQLHFRHREN